jgi:hypothetical protein
MCERKGKLYYAAMDEGRKRVLAIVAGGLKKLRLGRLGQDDGGSGHGPKMLLQLVLVAARMAAYEACISAVASKDSQEIYKGRSA